MSVDFQSAYLKEIGVQTPISSFFVDQVSQNQIPSAVTPVVYDPNTVEVVHQATQATNQPAAVEVAEPAFSSPVVAEQEAIQKINIEVIENMTPSTVLATDLSGLKVQVEACKACELVGSRNQVVFGKGSTSAGLVFIGDSPSRDEDVEGLPFVGRGGDLFERMLTSISLTYDDVYVMNGVKCRPQHGRDAKPTEFAACERWLVSQLDMIQPRLICMLGRVIAQSLLKTEASLTELRAGQFDFRGVPVVVIDHPSYLLRSQKHKRRAWQDLNRLQNLHQKYQTT